MEKSLQARSDLGAPPFSQPAVELGGHSGVQDLEIPIERHLAVCTLESGILRGVGQAPWERGAERAVSADGPVELQSIFNSARRWLRTAADPTPGDGPHYGRPVTLTWGILPDGATISGGDAGVGEPSSPSALMARLDAVYGSSAEWLPLFEAVFARWAEVTGNTYVYEPFDDGAPFPASPGVAGVRPDIRIGGHPIDGDGNHLAYSFFPESGDTVIDTADASLDDVSGNSIRLRNTLSHEHGHQLGLGHVCPADGTKLMETDISTAIDGPQQDDILRAQRLYGDAFEPNGTSASAAYVGELSQATPTVIAAGLHGSDDVDVFSFDVSASGFTVSAAVSPAGSEYLVGNVGAGGECEGLQLVDTRALLDLALRIFDADGEEVLAVSDRFGAGGSESTGEISLPGAGRFYVEASGAGADQPQLYRLELHLGLAGPAPRLQVEDVFADESAGHAAVTVSLSNVSAAPVSFRAVTADGSARAPGDYDAIDAAGMIQPGETSVEIEVPLVSDAIDEADEMFAVTISEVENAAIEDAAGVITIIDDDPAPTLSISDASPVESAGAVSLAVTLSGPSERPVSVRFHAADGTAVSPSDFQLEDGIVSFEPGQSAAVIAAAITDDDIDELNEWFEVELSDPQFVTLGRAAARVTILDDDPLPVVSAAPTASAGEDDGAVSILLTLTRPSDRAVRVALEIRDGMPASSADFQSPMPLLIVPAGETSAYAAAPLADDDLEEADEAFLLSISGAVNASVHPNATTITGIIFDDDAPRAFRGRVPRLVVAPEDDEVSIVWTTVPGRNYAVEISGDLLEWQPAPGAEVITATGDELSVILPRREPGGWFFRVADRPAPQGDDESP